MHRLSRIHHVLVMLLISHFDLVILMHFLTGTSRKTAFSAANQFLKVWILIANKCCDRFYNCSFLDVETVVAKSFYGF